MPYTKIMNDADKIERAVEKMGLKAYRSSSRISYSEYVEVYKPDNDGEPVGGKAFKIRISDHFNRQSQDFDVFPRGGKELNGRNEDAKGYTDGSWADAVAAVAREFEKPMPAYVQKIYEKDKAEKAEKQRIIEAAREQYRLRRQAWADAREQAHREHLEKVVPNLDKLKGNLDFLENLNVCEYKRSCSRKNAEIVCTDGQTYNLKAFFPYERIAPANFPLALKEFRSLIEEAEQLVLRRESIRSNPYSLNSQTIRPDKAGDNQNMLPSEFFQTASSFMQQQNPQGGLKTAKHHYQMQGVMLTAAEKQQRAVLEHAMEQTVKDLPPDIQNQARTNFYLSQIRQTMPTQPAAAKPGQQDEIIVDR